MWANEHIRMKWQMAEVIDTYARAGCFQ
jgi:hypothetical protein